MAVAEPKPYKIKIWTSSHGTDYHHFPPNLEEAFLANTHPDRDTFFQLPCVDAIPGRKVTTGFVKEVTSDFENIPPEEKRINIILMGDNDIRCMDFVGACRIEDNIQKLIQLHKGSRHALVVCGLMPSPATWVSTSMISDRVSSRLNRQVMEANSDPSGRYISFLQISQIFADETGLIDVKQYFEKDGIHLNPAGAQRLAQYLIHNIVAIIETFLRNTPAVEAACQDLNQTFLQGINLEAATKIQK